MNTNAKHSFDEITQVLMEIGRELECTAVLEYLGEAMRYYHNDSDDESKEIGDRLHQSLKAVTISEIIQGIIAGKHRT